MLWQMRNTEHILHWQPICKSHFLPPSWTQKELSPLRIVVFASWRGSLSVLVGVGRTTSTGWSRAQLGPNACSDGTSIYAQPSFWPADKIARKRSCAHAREDGYFRPKSMGNRPITSNHPSNQVLLYLHHLAKFPVWQRWWNNWRQTNMHFATNWIVTSRRTKTVWTMFFLWSHCARMSQ